MTMLATITNLAEQMLSLEGRIVNGEELLQKLKKEHRDIQEGDLPEAMESEGLDEIKLSSGRTIVLEVHTHTSISATNQEEAFAWLRANGYSAIVKRQLVVKFSKGEEKRSRRLYNYIVARKYLKDSSIVSKESVHPSTLKAFVRQALEEGEDLPLEVFGVHQRLVAKAGKKITGRKQK